MPIKTEELCSICGAELEIQTAGLGEGTLYACVNDDSPELSEKWLKHYRQSEITVVQKIRDLVSIPTVL